MAYSTGIPDWEDMNAAQKRAAEWAWSHGELDSFVLPHQETLWAIICNHMGLPTKFTLPEKYKDVLGRTSTMKPLVIEVSRRFGKSSLILLAMMALCIRNKKHTYYFVAPNEGDAEDILDDVGPPLLATCPPRLRPKKMKMTYTFPTSSRIKIGGTFNGGEGLRGKAANGSAIDEAGTIPFHSTTSCLTYVISSVMLPQLSTTRGWQIILTTPPSNMQHDYYELSTTADDEGRFIRMTIYENTSFSPEEIQEMKEASLSSDPSGGAWEREYMCHPIADVKSLIVPPNVQDVVANNIIDYPRPSYFEYLHRYIIIDHGTVDLNAIIFGYYDYPHGKYIVEREIKLARGPTTKQIGKMIREERLRLWGNLPIERAIIDGSPQIRIDLNAEFEDIVFVFPAKSVLVTDNAGREGMVNKLIMALGDGQIVINPECKTLIETIRTAEWKVSNTGKREFARMGKIGHCDFLAALVYAWGGWYRNTNPLQGKLVPDIETHFITKIEQPQTAAHTLNNIINKKRPSIFDRANIFKR